MARPREFDPETALERALDLFWDQGYEATTVAQLVERTGVHKRSMYDAFGDKRALYLKALERYADENAAAIRAIAAGDGPPREAIRTLLMTGVPDAPDMLRGCLIVNCATELGASDAEAAAHVNGHFELNKSVMRALVERGQRTGEISDRIDAGALALLLSNAWVGLRVQARSGVPRAEIVAAVDAAMAVLG